MKERPILFNGPMVRAILDGRKTQTRRVVKPQPETKPHNGVDDKWFSEYSDIKNLGFLKHTCPFGQPGDRLWVREAFTEYPQKGLLYKADGCNKKLGVWWGWRPSIHMPRRASRIKLEVTDVRVERLQNISEEDIYAEGIDTNSHDFMELWDSINAKRGHGWDANPFVWVVEFRRVEP